MFWVRHLTRGIFTIGNFKLLHFLLVMTFMKLCHSILFAMSFFTMCHIYSLAIRLICFFSFTNISNVNLFIFPFFCIFFIDQITHISYTFYFFMYFIQIIIFHYFLSHQADLCLS